MLLFCPLTPGTRHPVHKLSLQGQSRGLLLQLQGSEALCLLACSTLRRFGGETRWQHCGAARATAVEGHSSSHPLLNPLSSFDSSRSCWAQAAQSSLVVLSSMADDPEGAALQRTLDAKRYPKACLWAVGRPMDRC